MEFDSKDPKDNIVKNVLHSLIKMIWTFTSLYN
jgi:hypothetical protein